MKKRIFYLVLFFGLIYINSVSAVVLLNETFESGSLATWNLTTNLGANTKNWTANFTDPFQGTFHAQSEPEDNTPKPASLMERTISTVGYQNISFNYYRKIVGFEAADEFRAEWWNGFTWISVELTNTSINDASYVLKQFNLTSLAENSAVFKIRFGCSSGSGEFCRVDNVVLSGNLIDAASPNISLTYPQNNGRYTSVQTALNFTVSDINLQACWYSTDLGANNNTVTCGNNVTGLNSGQGNSTWIVYANDSFGNTNSSSVTFSVDSISPSVIITHPVNGSSLGNNVSVSLNFSASDTNLRSCWYSLDSGANITLSGCGNSTFNVSEGSHTLRVYANDSFSNIGGSSSGFSVQVGAPSINIISPSSGEYISRNSIYFNYTASDATLSTCGLYGNFNGTYSLNQTNSTMSSGASSFFNLSLIDGNYLWAVSCNDTAGNRATTANRTVNVDTIIPSVNLNEPSGTYTSISNIPIRLDISDASPVRCFYNVTFAATGIVVIGNSELVDCDDSTFSVDIESSYFLTMSVNDSAGNINTTRNTFIVSSPSSGGGSSGGGGGGGSSFSGVTLFKLEISSLEGLRLNRGESEAVELRATNKGVRFLNDCYFVAKGGISNWISGDDIYSLSPGQSVGYSFNVNVPIDAEVGNYFTTIDVNCREVNTSTTYQVEVVGGEFELNIMDSERVGTKLSITYSIENFANEDKKLNVSYKFINSENEIVVEGYLDSVDVPALQKIELQSEFELPKNSIGNYNLVMDVTDGVDRVERQQLVRLTTGGISGFAISDNNLRTISWMTIVILLSFGIFVVFKFLRSQIAIRRASKYVDRQFISLDLH